MLTSGLRQTSACQSGRAVLCIFSVMGVFLTPLSITISCLPIGAGTTQMT